MKAFLAWVQQPTTVAGLAAFAGTASAMLLGQMSWVEAIPVLVGAATSMALPDNTGAKAWVRSHAPGAAAPERKA